MRSFVAFIVTGVLLGVFLTLYIRAYYPNAIDPYIQPQGLKVTIAFTDTANATQQNQVLAISKAVQDLNIPDVKVDTVNANYHSIPESFKSYMWVAEVVAAFAIITPIFILFGLIKWIIKVFE